MGDVTGKTDELNLSSLEGDYSIVGEVRGAAERRTFLARRRSDEAEVLIAVFSSAGAAENNALSHYAADTKMLTRVRHPGVVRPIDGRWMGTNAFAVVSERPQGTTLRQMLSTGERLTNGRIASLVRDVNGILAWAREQGVVHRGVALDAVFIEPLSGRLQLSLLPTPISPDRVPDSVADSTTIGKLTASLLAGRPFEGNDARESIASVRPDLAARVVEVVDRMRSAPGDAVHPEVSDFLSTIASADVLKEAELALDKQRAEYAEILRVHRETAEAERTASERRAAQMEEKLAADRHDFERRSEHERAELASERAQLVAERAQLAYEVGHLQQRRGTDQPGATAPEISPDLSWPEVDRRAHRNRLFGPVLLVAALIVAAVAVHLAQPRDTMPGAIAVGADTVVPTPPVVETSRLPKGGFLSQTAAGSIPPRAKALVPASPESSAVSIARDTVVRIDTAARRARLARRDSALRRDTTVHRDSLGFLRPDTLPPQ